MAVTARSLRVGRLLALVALCVVGATGHGADPLPTIPRDVLRSGAVFQSRETQAMQQDDLANPGMLWVEEGARLWSTPPREGVRACAGCHGESGESMRGVAARHPRHDPRAGRVIDLEQRIETCRAVHQDAPPLGRESRELVALTSFVAHQSRGLPLAVDVEGPARPSFESGARLFHARQGQQNLACAHCHDANWGRSLGGERLSQGHPNGYPAYRLEWQAVGSLQRRLRACAFGVSAEMPAYGAQELVDLALFLAWRARGLAIETPAVRR